MSHRNPDASEVLSLQLKNSADHLTSNTPCGLEHRARAVTASCALVVARMTVEKRAIRGACKLSLWVLHNLPLTS